MFEEIEFDDWAGEYHADVSGVVDAHIKQMADISESALQCTAEDYASVIPPSGALRSMAEKLPAWKEDDRLNRLSESDAGGVLMEFLRVYECSMNERSYYLSNKLLDEEGSMNLFDLQKKETEQRAIITRELDIARPAMARTLAIVGGFDRLAPLSVDIECLKRSSLDLRNVLGLAAEASACLPKAWDPHGSLRDLAD